jgi:hypothetical protein
MKSLRKYRVSKKRNRRMRKTSISHKKRKINQVGGVIPPKLFEDLVTKYDSSNPSSENKLNEDLLKQLSPDQFVELVRRRSGLGFDLEKVIKDSEPALRSNYKAWYFQPDTVEELITKGKSHYWTKNGDLKRLMHGLSRLYVEINTEERKLNPAKAKAEDDARVAARTEKERREDLEWSKIPLSVRADMMGAMAIRYWRRETPAETAARKAKESAFDARLHEQRKRIGLPNLSSAASEASAASPRAQPAASSGARDAMVAEAARRRLTPDLLRRLNAETVAEIATRRAGIVPPADCVQAMVRAGVSSAGYRQEWTRDYLRDDLLEDPYFRSHPGHCDQIIDALVAMAAEADAQGARDAMDAEQEFDTLTETFNNLKISSGSPSSRYKSPTLRRSKR